MKSFANLRVKYCIYGNSEKFPSATKLWRNKVDFICVDGYALGFSFHFISFVFFFSINFSFKSFCSLLSDFIAFKLFYGGRM